MENNSVSVLKRPNVLSFVVEFKGEREEMQDYFLLNENFSSMIWPDKDEITIDNHHVRLYAIFDGHGGKQAAYFVSQTLPLKLKEKFKNYSKTNFSLNLKKSIIETFKEIDEEFLQEAVTHKPTWSEGSTATVILLIDNSILYIANIGDSLAILARLDEETNNLKVITLTQDHVPSVYEERVRIQKCGGKVIDGRLNGILEVSRAFGDGKLKKLGLIALPSIKKCNLHAIIDKFVIIACDGLWKAFAPEEVISKTYGWIQDQVALGKSLDEAYEFSCLALAQQAAKSLCGDNITVILIRLQT